MANLRMAKRKDIYEYLILGWNKFHFVQKKQKTKKNTNYNKKLTDTIKMLESLLMSFNRKSAFLWVPTVQLYLPTCCFIRMRHTSYMGF